MKAEFTPGPWRIGTGSKRIIMAANNDVVARAADYGSQSDTPDFQYGNARLIAAAPDLLVTLQLLSQWREVIAKSDVPAKSVILEDFDDARAAIAKATGE